MIDRILPTEVATATAYEDPADVGLFPEEEAAIVRAVHKRRQEFTTVRWCARRALAGLGLPPAPITPGEMGAPRWPEGVIGSMTHCDGYRAAAVARVDDLVTIGIDAEPHHQLPDGILETIALEEELAAVGALGRTSPQVHWDRLLFSAKESVYKAWFPVTGRWLGFEDASIAFDPAGTFVARILAANAPYKEFLGRWIVGDGLVASAVSVSV